MIDLKGKTALVTGGTRGIGKEILKKLAPAGADVCFADVIEDGAVEVETEINGLGVKCSFFQGNVASLEDCKNLVDSALSQFGKIDILVNNAGAFPIKPFPTVSEEEWDRVMDLDLKSVFLCCREALAPMRQQRGGTIVNIASVSGLVGALGMVPYSAAKGGVIAFTKALARELASLQLTGNAIAPGIIETETALEGFPPGALEAYKTQQVPLGRLGRPEDVVGLAVFLASPEASYITGQVYAVDGGFTMQ